MKNYKYLLTTFFPLHILLVSLFFFVDYNFISLLYFLAGYIFIGGYGVAIGLHRWASHRSIILKSWAENLIIYADLNFKSEKKRTVNSIILTQINLEEKKLEMDFVVESVPNQTHILNAVSPAWTGSLSFGEYVADKVLAQL